MAKGVMLIDFLNRENGLLDQILDCQTQVHISVKTKNWIGLEENVEKIQRLSAEFSQLDQKRDEILSGHAEISAQEKSLMVALHSKLLKSKIQNQVLDKYIEASKEFVQGILDNAVPMRRNILYSRNGKIVKRVPESVVLNRVL